MNMSRTNESRVGLLRKFQTVKQLEITYLLTHLYTNASCYAFEGIFSSFFSQFCGPWQQTNEEP